MSRSIKTAMFSIGIILSLGKYSGEYNIDFYTLAVDPMAFHKFIAWLLIVGVVSSMPNLVDSKDGDGLGHSLILWCLVVSISYLSLNFLEVPRFLALSIGIAYGLHLMLDYISGTGVRLLGRRLCPTDFSREDLYSTSAEVGLMLTILMLMI